MSSSDFSASPAVAEWPEAPSAVDHQRERELIGLFAGPKAELYQATYDKMRAKSPEFRKLAIGWCWPAFFFTLPWLLYRKQWVYAAVILFLPAVLTFLFAVPNESGLAFTTMVAIMGKSFYVHDARRTIRRILDEEGHTEQARQRIARAGGTSTAGAVVGTAIFVIALAAQIAAGAAAG